MAIHEFTLECPVRDGFRVRQIAGMFDLPVDAPQPLRFRAELPDPSEPWQIGLIVGPSGSGKSSLAKRVYGPAVYQPGRWPIERAVIDCFDPALSIRKITRTLTAVGFSSPPAWLRPYDSLSTGERFRCDLAKALLARPSSLVPGPLQVTRDKEPGTNLVVFDEFTSVVDRTVAKICSAAVSKAIRSGAIAVRFVAVTCHHDIAFWLGPDWILDTATGALSRKKLRRPSLRLTIRRAARNDWEIFKRHHYLTGTLHSSAQCFVGSVDGRPAAFAAALPFPHPNRPGWREHRTVCLPDFQGVGIGTAISDFVASLYASTGKPYFSTTSHPAMIAHRARSPLWRMHRPPGMAGRSGATSRDTCGMARTNSRGRITAGFEYVGPTRPEDARRFGIP